MQLKINLKNQKNRIEMELKNKVIIVTGSSRGIGKEIALLLAKNGAKVVVNHSHSEAEAKAYIANHTFVVMK